MAVTLTERFRANMGGKKWICYHCVLPVNSAAITAASLDLTYIDASWLSHVKLTLSTTVSIIAIPLLKYDGASTGITISGVSVAADEVILNVIGW